MTSTVQPRTADAHLKTAIIHLELARKHGVGRNDFKRGGSADHTITNTKTDIEQLLEELYE
ncbi:hypothetical protein [Halococcus saccharolyticus]|uniref:Uncharacterized protein n=1 Tax=Halococcus saccharolyticus DSM 5350 TaxID=1227455 RepID=M0MSA7_9EURY|nr:hypothetical protein [Halococcus saccharolyticus]EMA47624.1 hypothetical protein C449_01137 [Halococcus saccharolyticus DSM 5350]